VSRDDRFVPPTILDFKNDWESFQSSTAMAGEIFGPLLPIIRYKTTEQCSQYLSSLGTTHGSQLVMYVFSNEGANSIRNQFLSLCSSGGVVINDCGIHIAEGCLPFGGIGKSGMGKYHNGKTFELFTHYRSVLWKTGYLDVPFRYPPMGPVGTKLMAILLWAARKNVTPIRVAKTMVILGLLYKIFRR
jgi:aldehyde dehydrogenase (NAD+)